MILKKIDNRLLLKYGINDCLIALQVHIEREEKELPKRIAGGELTVEAAKHGQLRLRRTHQILKELSKMPHTIKDIYSRIGEQTKKPENTAPRSQQGGTLF